MLQFWKRSGQKERARSTSSSPSKCSRSSSISNGDTNNQDLIGRFSFIEDDFEGDDRVSRKRSRLSKCLSEVLSDKGALAYFIQFMEAQNAAPLIKCWLDMENFCLSASRKTVPDIEESNISPLPSSRETEHDSLSVSTDCDSGTADSHSMVDYPISCETKSDKCNVNCDKDSDTSHKVHNSDNKNCLVAECTNEHISESVSFVNDKFNRGDGRHQDGREKVSRAVTDDAVRIFKKYIAQEAPFRIYCTDEMRNGVIETICNQSNNIEKCFESVQLFIFNKMDKEYFNDFLRSDFHCKHQIDVLTSGNVLLEDILYNQTALFYFMEFLEQEENRRLLEFWLAATNFQQQISESKTYDRVEVQNDAVILYDKYFSLQATCPLGFSDKIRFYIEENICNEDGPKVDCFERPLQLAEYYLERNYLNSFLSSQLFFKYLSELINTIQTSGYSRQSHKRTNSECSSELSISAQNTLLAMEDQFPKSRSRCSNNTDMSIDTRQLYDPDSLWKRKNRNGLIFGKVSALGRYETEMEPEPDKRMESKFAKAVKRLVSMEDKTKEEMAWQVAEMIVKDVTSVTMSASGAHVCRKS